MTEIDKRDIVIELLKNENDGLYLAYGKIVKRLRLSEDENCRLKEKLKKQESKKKNEKSK